MLNVLYVFGGEKASGAEKVIQRLIQQNTDRVNPYLFISPGNFAQNILTDNQGVFIKVELPNQLKKLNRSKGNKIKFYFNAIKNHFSVSFLAIRYIYKHNINAVHANTIVPSAYLIPAILFSKIFLPKIKWVWSDHDLKYFSWLDHKLSIYCVKVYDLTLTVSDAVKRKYDSNSKIITLYNGLNLNEFKADSIVRKKFRDNLEIKEGIVIIGLAGTIEPRKGQLELIDVFLKLHEIHQHSFLLLAGSKSDDHPKYVNAVINAAEGDSIRYLGRIEDMSAFYNGCDILISNSNENGSEPLGTTIYEAMAFGKIVVASDTGGTPEIIDDKINGYLFRSGDMEDLYQTLDAVFVNINTLKGVTVSAKEKVDERFNILDMAARYNVLLKFNQ
jgi:glycosyltransferase involved in cell wall biosynthesis